MTPKKTAKKAPGRPVAANPKSVLISFRIDATTQAAIERVRQKMGVETFSVSDTVREMTVRALKADGLL